MNSPDARKFTRLSWVCRVVGSWQVSFELLIEPLTREWGGGGEVDNLREEEAASERVNLKSMNATMMMSVATM